MGKYVEYVDGSWSVLYVDGVLDTAGDTYLTDERLRALLQVEQREGSDYFLGADHKHENISKSLSAIDEYVQNNRVTEIYKSIQDLRVKRRELNHQINELFSELEGSVE